MLKSSNVCGLSWSRRSAYRWRPANRFATTKFCSSERHLSAVVVSFITPPRRLQPMSHYCRDDDDDHTLLLQLTITTSIFYYFLLLLITTTITIKTAVTSTTIYNYQFTTAVTLTRVRRERSPTLYYIIGKQIGRPGPVQLCSPAY